MGEWGRGVHAGARRTLVLRSRVRRRTTDRLMPRHGMWWVGAGNGMVRKDITI